MNREMRRLSEREERRSKKGQGGGRGRGPSAPVGKGSKGGAPKPADRPSLWARLSHFLREVRVELNRVNWPTRQQMIAFTSVTLITTVALTGVIFVLDFTFRQTILSAIRAIIDSQ